MEDRIIEIEIDLFIVIDWLWHTLSFFNCWSPDIDEGIPFGIADCLEFTDACGALTLSDVS